jgi:hypothetical protein
LLQGKIYARDSEAYNARLESYYSANSALPPTCMAMPTSTEDVAAIASIISARQCLFGMRSGAHAAWEGSNSVAEGVTVDFGMFESLDILGDGFIGSRPTAVLIRDA